VTRGKTHWGSRAGEGKLTDLEPSERGKQRGKRKIIQDRGRRRKEGEKPGGTGEKGLGGIPRLLGGSGVSGGRVVVSLCNPLKRWLRKPAGT